MRIHGHFLLLDNGKKNLGFITYTLIVHRLSHIRLGPSFKRYVGNRVDALRDRLEELNVADSRNPLSRLLQDKLKSHMTDLDEYPESDPDGEAGYQDVVDTESRHGLKSFVPSAASPAIEEVLANRMTRWSKTISTSPPWNRARSTWKGSTVSRFVSTCRKNSALSAVEDGRCSWCSAGPGRVGTSWYFFTGGEGSIQSSTQVRK